VQDVLTTETDDVRAFTASVRDVLGQVWGPATAAGGAGLADVAAQAERLGWFDLGDPDDPATLAILVGAVRETGRVACPLPLIDAFVAQRLGAGAGTWAVVPAADQHDHVEAGDVVTSVLVFPETGGRLLRRAVRGATPTPGIAAPAWSQLDLGEPADAATADAAAVAEASAVVRLGLAARALAAAQRAHELAIEHAKTRRQFGRPIGQFGAVQQRLAAREIDVQAANALLDEAVAGYDAGDDGWPLAAEIAVTWIDDVARTIQLDAHHTLGALGFFEEHEAPWLFRRVHADLARVGSFRTPGSTLGDRLAEGAHLPAFAADAESTAFRAELRALFAAHRTTDVDRVARYDTDAVLQAMIDRGLFGIGWPESLGGRGASMAEQVTLTEEITYNRVPAFVPMGAVAMLGNTIVEHGTPEQQATYLPLVRRAELRFCLGYSEPEAGSDLASLRTRAVRDGDGWVIDGQKLWTTRGHIADYVWLAARTNPDAEPRHAGITVFLVPMDTPGITVHEHRALSGEISCSVFYDGVRVPDSARIGEVDGGWRIITFALAGERIHMAGVSASVLRQLDDLLALVHPDPDRVVGPRGSAGRAALGSMAAKLQATRALISLAVDARAAGRPDVQAPMAGVLGGELTEEFGGWVQRLLGPDAALSSGSPGAIADGTFEAAYRLSPMYVIGGGTNDIQRSLVARSLGLPRGY
jgi:alkylation response protein AidB-like acyl-CoA dehydrogenase